MDEMECAKPSVASTSSLSLADFRNSIHDIRNGFNAALENEQIQANNEKRWRLSHLKGQFESLQLHKLFRRYIDRINSGYFSEFLFLQTILSTTHFLLVLIPNKGNPVPVLPDLILYLITTTSSLIVLLITDFNGKNSRKCSKILSIAAFILIFFTNVFVPIYHSKIQKSGNFRPAYTDHLVISSYVFLGIYDNVVAIILGFSVSIFHIVILIMTAYVESSMLWQRLLTDTIFLICINGLGVYFRYMNEIVKRRSFLDRRAYVESTLQLRFEKEQEYQLMSSIIPKHIIDNVREDIMKYWDHIEKKNKIPRQKPFDNPYVEVHDNVTILFADIVNYTEMTSKLNINDLLETLNDLFGKFDDASEELKVLRIKFLGDCYYCVSGLPPNPAPNHAEACVDLGLRMISIISNVRSSRNLNINMRIGIHTGKIVSGIIGSIKWQYDIWSDDVDIANKMESEGIAGKVHITEQTRILLKKNYDIVDYHKGETVPLFILNNIKTYLISPIQSTEQSTVEADLSKNNVEIEPEVQETVENQRRNTVYKKRNTITFDPKLLNKIENNNHNSIDYNKRRDTIQRKVAGNERRYSGNPTLNSLHQRRLTNSRASTDRRLTPGDRQRRTAFMNNNIKRYEERLNETNKELKRTIENMSLTKYEQWFKVNEMNRWFLAFKNLKSELNFVKMPDPLFKYYLLSEIVLLVLIFVMENLTLPRWDWTLWGFYLTFAVIVFIFLPSTWTHYLWSRHVSKNEYDPPKNVVMKFFYDQSKFVTNNAIMRLIIYSIVCILFGICVLSEMIECKNAEHENATTTQNLLKLILRLTPNRTDRKYCIIPWHMTETCALAIIMTFVFLRMYIWIKFLYAMIITIIYIYCVWNFSDGFFENNETFNYLMKPQTAHTMSVVFLTITLHLIDRQTEYMNKLDHLWYETLIKEQGKANSIHIINNMLLKNILPIHVAELYLDVNRQNRSSTELYHEQYDGDDSVAVMFASIVNYSTDLMTNKYFLEVMNKIICDFDTLLVGNNFGRPIEKIKIAKWTYMAACGLVPGLGNAENIRRDQINHAVISLIKFASCLMKKLKQFNGEIQQNFQLRVGISYGAIAAGVVGSKKPLYDIWGDPVNMASRMDTTGLPNCIQVLRETADIIQKFGYVCNYRGETFVKGKDTLDTYFVALDENFDLIKQNEHFSE